MKIATQVKSRPGSAHDADALAAAPRACNRAASWVSAVAFAKNLKRRDALHHEVNYGVKATFDLAAQATAPWSRRPWTEVIDMSST